MDTRAWGGYVVGAGTVLANGGYEPANDTGPAELPGWLVQATVENASPAVSAPVQIRSTNPTAYGTAALQGEAERVRAAQPGRHNEVLSTAAYTIGRKVGARLIDHTTARTELIAAGQTLIGSEHWPPNTPLAAFSLVKGRFVW